MIQVTELACKPSKSCITCPASYHNIFAQISLWHEQRWKNDERYNKQDQGSQDLLRILTALGCWARDFSGITTVVVFGADSSNANGSFVLSAAGVTSFTLTATGANEGIVIVATITQQGVSGTPTITMP